MAVSIPCREDPHWEQITELDGTEYKLAFRWNQRQARYSLSLYTPDDTPIALGAKLVIGWPLFLNATSELMPKGAFVVVGAGESLDNPGIGELGIGKRCELLYLSAEEVASAKAAK